MTLTPDPHEGTPGSYRNGCRCSACRKAWSVYSIEARKRRSERLDQSAVEHGSPWTAVNYGCTCSPCVLAYRDTHRRSEWARRFRAGELVKPSRKYRAEYAAWLAEAVLNEGTK